MAGTVGADVLETSRGNFNLLALRRLQVRAWVSFNGTGVVGIRGAKNVSSITDLGVGNYRVTFLTPLANANYAIAWSLAGPSAFMPKILDEVTPRTAADFIAYCSASAASSNVPVDPTYWDAIITGGT